MRSVRVWVMTVTVMAAPAICVAALSSDLSAEALAKVEGRRLRETYAPSLEP